ncbi:MAG: type 4a pilus biogenesis protein PilO [Elusimicrobia bacterium]|nr:type 4a pilus biogenesis protein PilO [Elusimicrobiota bacterium]
MKFNISKEMAQKILIGVLMSGLVVYSYSQYFLMPTLASIKENKKKIEELSKRVDELERRARKRDKLLAEIAEAEAMWAILKAKLPEQEDLPSILRVIDKIGRKFRLKVQTITPSPISGAELYNEIPFSLAVTGAYHDVAMFLEAVGRLERIFHARDLNLSAGSPTTEAPWTSVSGNLILVTFQYRGS